MVVKRHKRKQSDNQTNFQGKENDFYFTTSSSNCDPFHLSDKSYQTLKTWYFQKCYQKNKSTVGSGDHGCLIFAKFQTSGDNSKIQISGESLKHLKVFRDIWSTK